MAKLAVARVKISGKVENRNLLPKVHWSDNDASPQFRLVIRVSSNFYEKILRYMRDRLSTTFQEPREKAELLKLAYGNRLKATESGRY